MKTKWFTACAVFCALLLSVSTAQPAGAGDPAKELGDLVSRIQAKLRAGERTAAGLSSELQEFAALRAKFAGQKTDDVAKISFMEASLYRDVLQDTDKATALLKEMEEAFAGTPSAARATAELAATERRATATRTKTGLAGKPAPEITFTWSTQPGLGKLSDLKGKVVVLDFWATWCGPCVATFPQIRELVEHYKNADVAVVGVTSLQGYHITPDRKRISTAGDPKKEQSLMTDYIKEKNITWTVVFSEERVFNPNYGISGIPHMAIIAPDGTVRHNGLHPGMPHAQKTAMIDAILKEFGKPAAKQAGE